MVTKRPWKYVITRSVREFVTDECPDAAAALTYYAVLAVFPAVIAVFSLLGIFGKKDDAAATILGLVEEIAPGGTADTLRGPIEHLAQAPGAGIALVVGIVVALWSASRYVAGFSRALNRIYGVAEGRPFWKLRPLQLLITLFVVVSAVAILVTLTLSGEIARVIGERLGVGETAQRVWSIGKWPLLALVVVMLVAVLYYATPNVRQPAFRWVSPGAVVAIGVLVIASVGFSVYVSTFANYNRTYGSLAGVIVLLLWMWIANLALLFGAEFDAELERSRELQEGVGAEKHLQLPPRDLRQILKQRQKEREDVSTGSRIREESES